MNNFEPIFVFAKKNLKSYYEQQQEKKEETFQQLLLEIQQEVMNEISGFVLIEDVYKLGILLYLLKKIAEKEKISHKMDLLINVLETLPNVMGGCRYQDIPLIDSLTNFSKADEESLKKEFMLEV